MSNLSYFVFILFLTIFFSSLLSNWLIKNLTFDRVIDIPNERKIHSKPKLRVGGLPIFLSSIFAVLLTLLFCEISSSFPPNSRILFTGAFLIYLIGFFEDIYRINPFYRLIMQFSVAIYICINGLLIPLDNFQTFLSSNITKFLSYFMTTFWIVGLINAINWMDGLDGLAAGVSFILLVTYSIIALKLGLGFVSIISICIACAALGFLIFNFYPSKIHMGDSGSYFLGYVLSIEPLVLINNQNFVGDSFFSLINYYSPMLLMSVPIWDMIIVLKNRILNGYSPFFPDKTHLHHRLMDLGFNQVKTMLTIYFIVMASTIPSLLMIFSRNQ